MQGRGSRDQERVRTASGRSETRREKETGGGREFPGTLVLLKLEGEIGRLVAHGHGGAYPVERLALEVVLHILGRVVAGAPAAISLISDVHVNVVHRGHDSLARKVDANGAGRLG